MNEENDMKEEKTMSIQDRLERIFKEMHIMLSRGPVLKEDERYVIVHKKDMIHQSKNFFQYSNNFFLW